MKSTVLAALLLGAICNVAVAAPSSAAQGPHERLLALFAASDEATLERNPVQALVRNDLRYAARFGDYISDAYFAAEKAA